LSCVDTVDINVSCPEVGERTWETVAHAVGRGQQFPGSSPLPRDNNLTVSREAMQYKVFYYLFCYLKFFNLKLILYLSNKKKILNEHFVADIDVTISKIYDVTITTGAFASTMQKYILHVLTCQ
jgi:hypothetical protein